MARLRIGRLGRVGVALALGALSVVIWAAANPLAPTEAVMHVAAVGDIHDEGLSSSAAATAAEAAKADFILGLGDYQYDDGALWKYNAYFDNDWGPNVPKMYPVFAAKHDRGWTDADPLKYFNGGGPHGYRSPVTLKPY